MRNLSGEPPTRYSRSSLGKPNPITLPSLENATYTIWPTRNLTRPCTKTSYERGSVDANLRTSSMVTTRPMVSRRLSGVVSDALVFATNLVFLTPAAGWLESLVQRSLGQDDPVAGRQLATWLGAIVVLQALGAYLK